jgi:hypothetical protein
MFQMITDFNHIFNTTILLYIEAMVNVGVLNKVTNYNPNVCNIRNLFSSFTRIPNE